MKMKSGQGWIRGLRGQEHDISSLACIGNHFSSYIKFNACTLNRVNRGKVEG